jgi:hypothetical protein
MEERGLEAGLAEALCYEHGNRRMATAAAGVRGEITETETLMGYASDERPTTATVPSTR